jgi:hypothetical protein
MTKRSGNQPGNEVEQNIMQTELVNENTPIEVKQENNMIMTNNDAGGMVSDIIMPSPQSHSSDVSSQYQQQPKIDETTINDMVVRAIEPFQREVSRIQDTVNDVRGEINSIRSTIQELTSTFETSLTDLKAFQTEIANPLNFMRKYFDSIDIKGLSDPTLPLHVEQPYINTRNNTIENPMEKINHLEESNPDTSSDNNSSTQFVKQSEEPLSKHEVQESLPLNQLFNGGLTLGKLMTTTTILEEILQTVDRSSIDILIEQCKLMGLRQEDEHVIYNIINLMDQSGLSVKEILVMLYKFGKVMGIADKEADLTYAKLIMNQNKMHGTAITTESRV